MPDEQSHKGQTYRLRVVREQGEIEPEFSNNFVVQADGPEFHIRFYQIHPPIILGESAEERRVAAEQLGNSVTAKCVAHIVMAKDRYREFVDVLTEHARKHLGDRKSLVDKGEGNE